MRGTVAHVSPSRRLALITPIGQDRASDIVIGEIWFTIANLEPPFVGMIVEFDLSVNADGYVEATNVRSPAASAEGSCPSTPAS